MKPWPVVVADLSAAHDGKPGEVILLADKFDAVADIDVQIADYCSAVPADVLGDRSLAADGRLLRVYECEAWGA